MNVENAILSEEYQQANKTHSEAFKAYVLVRDAYRAGKLADQKFIAAQKEYFAALAVWELAYEKERN